MRQLLGFIVSRPAVSAGFILVVCVTLYANSLKNDFQYDDRHSIVSNHHLRDVAHIPGFFLHPEQFSRDPDKAMFRPLLLASFALNYAWGEYDPGSYHVVNVVIHALCAILVMLLLSQFGIFPCIALLGGLLFAVHPICTEPVNYISSRSELLAGLGVLGSFWLYGQANRPEISVRYSTVITIGSLLLFVVGLLSKSIAIVLPVLVVYRDLCLNVDRPLAWRRYTPYAIISVVYLLYMKTFLATALLSAPVRSLSCQLAIQLKAVPYYLKLLFLPSGLTVAHSFRAADLSGWIVSLALVALIPVALLVARGWRGEWQIVLFGCGWMLIVAAPTFVVPLNVLVNEHRLYLPLAGAVIAVVGIPRFESIRGLLPGATLVLALFSVLVVNRNAVWADEWSLWKDASMKAPHEAQPYVYMGNFARGRQELSQSTLLLEKALQLDEENVTARASLAETFRRLGRLEEAAAMYEEMTAQFPESSDLRYNLGRTYQDMGDSDSARRSYLSVDEKSPHFHLALNNIGTLFDNVGRLDSALYYYSSALRVVDVGSADARANVDRISFKLTDAAQDLIKRRVFGEARTLCRQFLSIEPFHRDALFWLSVALLYDGIYEESIEVNERLVAAHPDYGEGYLQLGNALETAGRGSDAIGVYRRLLAITDDERLRQVGSTRLSKLEAAGSR